MPAQTAERDEARRGQGSSRVLLPYLTAPRRGNDCSASLPTFGYLTPKGNRVSVKNCLAVVFLITRLELPNASIFHA